MQEPLTGPPSRAFFPTTCWTRVLEAYLRSVEQRMRSAELDRARAEARAIEERKRRRWQLGLAASLAAFLVLGAAGLGAFATVVSRKNAELAAQRQRAEDREQRATDSVKRFRDAVADNPTLKNSPELEELRRTLLKQPLEFFQGLKNPT